MESCEECSTPFCEECGYCHHRGVTFHRCSNFREPERECPTFESGLQNLERDVIAYMRDALSAFDTNHSVVRDNMKRAHDLFADHLIKWSEEFGVLYNEMLEVYRAHLPQERGHYRTSHVGIGYSSFQTKTWIRDTVQPTPPTALELVARLDALLEKYINAHTTSR